MAATLAITFVAQGMFVVAFFLIASGLSDRPPSLVAHFVIVPLTTIVGVVPLPASGLGAVEFVMNELYTHATPVIDPAALAVPADLGVMVSLCNRVLALIVALVGVAYYLSARREVTQMIHEVEDEHVHSLLEAAAEDESPP